MPYKPTKYTKHIECLPYLYASVDEVQQWVLRWFVTHMDALDILDLRVENRVKLLPWDGIMIRKATRKELKLQLKWIFTFDGTAMKYESREDEMVDSLVNDIEGAKAWEAQQHNSRSAIEKHPLFSATLLASSVYLLARLGYIGIRGYGGHKTALDEAVGTTWAVLVSLYVAGKLSI